MNFLQTQLVFYNLFLVIIFLSELIQVSSLQCKGEHNENVDWFVLYKLPKIPDSKNLLIKEGVAYLYMDNNGFRNGWTLSTNNISSKNSIPAYTLAPFYDKNAKNLLWLLYNDQPPNEAPKINYGHTKGAVIANENNGFWLIHSVPNFPSEPHNGQKLNSPKVKKDFNKTENLHIKNLIGEYAYPSSGKINGQSFLCISINETNLNIIGKQLIYNEILVFKKNVPVYASQKYEVLVEAINKVHIKNVPYNNKVSIYSNEGEEFISFAKSSKWQRDLYDDFVAPQLETDLYTETWLNGRDRLPSDCHKSRVMNIESISLAIAEVHFKSSHDHSKWAISIDGNTNSWVCVGDINRAHTQFERGGGTVCLNLPELWTNYKDSVYGVEPCPKSNLKKFFNLMLYWFS